VADAVHQAGIYAGKILSGAKAADLLGHRADEFVTSLKTAPALLLARVDEVIE
jgi:hypothetical protein